MVGATAPVVPGLRGESREYAQRLREAGAPVTERCHTGHIHPFSNVPGVGRTVRASALEIARAIREGLGAHHHGKDSQP